ncbi:MAG: hypothetical protein EP318_04530 [Rhodobacteraceae bacterium]|nr:MAG: hypothetical protein EP318_04530 [Paracoccaceae bacterium]
MTDTRSLISVLRQQAATRGAETAFRFLIDGARSDAQVTFADLDRSARATAVALLAAARAQGRDLHQQPVLIALPAGLEFLGAFFGCLYAGAIAVPIRHPRPNRPLDHSRNVAADSQALLAWTTPEMQPVLSEALAGLPVLTLADLADARDWRDPGLGPEAIANLQYTSGSTAAPKGVAISHGNILANSAEMQRVFAIDAASRLMSWLPHYHDLGLLFGCVLPVHAGCRGELMAPAGFARRPAAWLEALTAGRITHSAAPNFGYEACLAIPEDRRAGFDLSALVALLNGAEPVRAETIAAFQQAFAPHGLGPRVQCPSYGMAENTLVTSANGPGCAPLARVFDGDALAARRLVPAGAEDGVPAGAEDGRTRTLVACNGTRMATEVVIADPDTGAPLPDGAVGEIWQAGPLVAQGYWRRPDLTTARFHARLAGQEEGPDYLRTGDLGARLDGALYILGRMDDVMVLRGVNISPEDLELTVEACDPALEPGGAAAFAAEIGGELRLVIAHELRRTALRTLRAGGEEAGRLRDHLIRTLRAAVSQQHELEIGAIVFLGPKALPKTHTGKKKRHACRAGFADGSLKAALTWVAPKYAEAAKAAAADTPPATGMTDRVRDLSGWLRHYAETRMNSRLIDERRTIPPHVVMDMGNRGLLGMIAPETYGGLGLSNRELAVMFQQLAAVDTTVASFVVVNNALGLRPILRYATPENRDELMPRLATGRELASFAMTEADAGSNIRNLSSIGQPDGNGGWRLWGTKWWSGTASWAGVINTFVTLQGSEGEARGVSGFVLRQGAEGLRNGSEALTMGLRGMVQSQVLLEGVRVTARDRLGDLGDGMTPATNAMEYGRFAIAGMALGIIKRCTQLMLRHASRRTISTGALIDNPATRLRISELGAVATAVEALMELVADRLDREAPVPIDLYCACKTSGPEYAWRAADGLIQQLAGRGYVETNIAPQILRDARVLRIFEGPTEPMHMHIGARLVHMPEELCGFLTEALGEATLATDLAEMAQEIAQRGQAQEALFGGPMQARQWAYLQIGEIATYGILRAALRIRARQGADAALDRAETWAEMRGQALRARALAATAGEAALLDRAQIEALAEGFAETIGDIEQSLPGEDRALDGLLARAGQAAAAAAPQAPETPPAPPARTEVVSAWLKRWMAREFAVRPETIADSDRFAAYGMDSVAAMMLVSALEDWTGTDLPPTLVWDHPSVAAIARAIAALPEARIDGAGAPAQDDLALLARVDELSEDELAALVARMGSKAEAAG